MESFLLYSLILSLNILMVNSEEICDCEEIKFLKEIIQKNMLEQKLETSKLLSRMRRMESRQRLMPTKTEIPGTGLTDRREKMETKFADIDVKVNGLLNEKSKENRKLTEVIKKVLMSEKQQRIEFTSNMDSKITDMYETVENFKTETINFIEQYKENITKYQDDFRQDTDSKLYRNKQQTDINIRSLEREVLEADARVSKLNDLVTTRKSDNNVAFTAYNLYRSGTSHTVLRFRSVYLNNGDAYNTATGKFTCRIPGVYYFAVTLTKRYKDIDRLYAHLRINDFTKLSIYFDPDGDNSNKLVALPLTTSGTFHLNTNDTVDVYGKPSHFYGSYSSSFTGILVFPNQ